MSTTKRHKDRTHALLSASGAYRWMACTPSAVLEDKFKQDDEGTVYTAEGTFAHELAEAEIKHALSIINPDQYEAKKSEMMKSSFFTDEMEEEVDKYVNEVLTIVDEARKKDRWLDVSIEDRFELTEYVPEGFGSNDAAIIADGCLTVVDLKYGKGVKVSAINNPQLRLYALGALSKYGAFHDIMVVEVIIVQPRLNNVSRELLSTDALTAWAEREVIPAAAKAIKGEGDLKTGDHCRFCKVAPRCKALAAKNLEAVKYEFEEPNLLSNAQLLDAYDKTASLIQWANIVREYVLFEAIRGVNFPGFKLVEGRANRKISDEDKAVQALKDAGFTEAQILNAKIKGLGDLTKLLGKKEFEAVLGPYVIKPQGAPALVPEDDSRPEFNNIESIKNQFP